MDCSGPRDRKRAPQICNERADHLLRQDGCTTGLREVCPILTDASDPAVCLILHTKYFINA